MAESGVSGARPERPMAQTWQLANNRINQVASMAAHRGRRVLGGFPRGWRGGGQFARFIRLDVYEANATKVVRVNSESLWRWVTQLNRAEVWSSALRRPLCARSPEPPGP